MEYPSYTEITAEVRVVNRPPWYLHYFVSTVRAEDCKARMLVFDRKAKTVYHGAEGIWKSTDGPTCDIPASFYPELLTILTFDPLRHEITSQRHEEGVLAIPNGKFELGLIVDAKGTSSSEVRLGDITFPDDFLKDTAWIDEWKTKLRLEDWAVFCEKTLKGELVAKVIGKVPDARLATMKSDLKQFRFEFL